MRSIRLSPRLLSALALMLAGDAACQPKAVRGGPGTENPNLDTTAMSTGLDRVDLQDLMARNMDALFASAFWNRIKQQDRPTVAIWPIKNDTSEHIGPQLETLLADMETQLVGSAAVRVISRERQSEMAEEVGIQQTAVYDPASVTKFGRQIGAKYFITGKVQSVDERMKGERRVQYSLFLQVIEVETSVVEFQNKTERTKAIVR